MHSDPDALKLEDNAVKIFSSGLYLFYAQVTLSKAEGSVDLYVDQTTFRDQRAISKAHGKSEDCVTMTGLHKFTVGDRVRLNITSKFMEDAHKTYWGLFLLPKGGK